MDGNVLYNRNVLEEISPVDPYGDGRPAVWPDEPYLPIRYVVVGEAPGKNEVKEGRIFVGDAGQLLREIEAEAGLTNVHHTNASLFRPTTGLVDAPPSPKLIREERPRLLLEISMLKPEAVIAVGATAWYALLGEQARMRGMVKEISIHGRVYPVWLTWHPAAVFYQPDLYPDIVTDFQRVAENKRPIKALRQAPSPGLPPKDTPLLSIDTESTSPHAGTAELLVVTLSDGTHYWAFQGEEDYRRLNEYLRTYQGQLVAHNGIGDETILRRHGIDVEISDDTLLQHLSQDERKGSHKLKVLGPTVAGIDTGIDWVWHHTHKSTRETDNEKVEWKDIPKEDLVPYCGQDSIVTAQLHQALERSSDERTRKLYSFLRRAFRAFADGTYRGVMVDKEALSEETAKEEERVNALSAGFGFNPESHPQTLKALREAGYRVQSTAASVLEKLEGELPERLRKYREAEKLFRAFLSPLPRWIDKDGRAHATYKIHGTDSGRTSCADPNLQQVPRTLKHLFKASPGHRFVGWDFATHEVRGLAYYSKDERLLKLLRSPHSDTHQYIADKLGIDRQIAKHSFFAAAYGAGPQKIVKTSGMKPRQALEIIRFIEREFSQLIAWKEKVWKEMYTVGYVETPYGRRRNFYYVNDNTKAKAERIAVNFLVQSLCGDIALESAIAVYEELGYPPLIFVHDFNCIEVPESAVKRTITLVKEIAGSIMPNKDVRFVPEIYVGQHWGELHAS